MNFEDIKNTWDKQSPPLQSDHMKNIGHFIRSRSETLRKSQFRIFAIAAVVGFAATSWITVFAILFLKLGIEGMQEADVFPPPTMLISPFYIITICLLVIINYIQQKQMEKTYESTLRGFAQQALAQTRNRIKLLRLAPVALICLWVTIVISVFAFPNLSLLSPGTLPVVIAAFLVDVIILTAFFWWSRRRIKKIHQPKEAELESIIASI